MGREAGGGVVECGGKLVVGDALAFIGDAAVLICHHSRGDT